MAVLILILSGAVVWLEVDALRRVGRASLEQAQIARPAPANQPVDVLIERTASDIGTLLELDACWFELFPFDELLPRIERGRIVLPAPEPGVAPCSNAGVELPVRANGLTVGRFVLRPSIHTVGVEFAPTARARAIAMADQVGPPLVAAMIGGDRSARG